MGKSDIVILMTKDIEKRTYKRHNCDAEIKWTPFNRTVFNDGREKYYPARVLNFSKSGLYLETRYSMKPGMTVLFRTEASVCGASEHEGYANLRTISLIEIKWCRELLKNGESYFGMGARYPILY